MGIIKVKLILEPFSPSFNREGFYYKPSKDWNYLVWCDKKYFDYLVRVYGEVPLRLNPVKLHLVGNGNRELISDFKVDLPETVLGSILEMGGECKVKIKRKGNTHFVYMGGKRLKKVKSI
jgi:hypothetical protein